MRNERLSFEIKESLVIKISHDWDYLSKLNIASKLQTLPCFIFVVVMLCESKYLLCTISQSDNILANNTYGFAGQYNLSEGTNLNS